MPVFKRLLPGLATVFLSACAASSLNQADRLPLQTPAPQPAKEESPDTPHGEDAVRKVALSMASMSDPTSKSYKIGPRDVLDITVFQAPELTKTIQVSEAGTVNFPLIGEIDAAGKTAREIEQELRKKLGAKYLQNPQISVFVKDYFSQRITIEGAIKKPGVYPIAGGMSLLQAIAQAQGFEDVASHTVVLFRQVNGKRLAARYDVSSIREGRGEDPELEAGDVIVVANSELKEGINLFLKFVPLATLAPYL